MAKEKINAEDDQRRNRRHPLKIVYAVELQNFIDEKQHDETEAPLP